MDVIEYIWAIIDSENHNLFDTDPFIVPCFYGDEASCDRRRRLCLDDPYIAGCSIIPPPEGITYYAPYPPGEGPFECICDSKNGFIYDESFDDGRCFDCSSID